MRRPTCRACRGQTSDLVLDLGEQPACDYVPLHDDPGADPVYPLQMWAVLVARAGLACGRSHSARGAKGRRASAARSPSR